MIRKLFRLMFCILFLITILVACATPTTTPTATPNPPTPTVTPIPTKPTVAPISPTPILTQPALVVKPGSITGNVDIGGRSLYILCMGEGSPTVIFESGWGMDYSYWGDGLAEVSKHTLACAYDRAGLDKSDPATTFPRTSQDMVNDLHALLTNASIPGPYILVGHSLGGFNIRLYASQYPQDVVGLVFVDSSHPDQVERICAAVPTASPNEDASFTQARVDCQATPVPVTDWSQVTEGLDFAASADQARATGPFGDLPLVVLVAQYSITGGNDIFSGISGEVWNQMQQDLAALSTQGQYILVTSAYHGDIMTRPRVGNEIIKMVGTLQSK